jgi:SAM-dependent MidA family methyltransferase
LAEPLAGFEAKLPPAVARARVGEIWEWRDDRFALDMARRVAQGGAALVIDYGHLKSHVGDTFQAVRSHRYASPLALPGMTDLTAHVDFDALVRAVRGAGARIHGPVEQGALLKQLGIETRAAALQANGSEEQRAGVEAALDRLVGDGPTAMGTMFKAIGLSAPNVKALLGFER